MSSSLVTSSGSAPSCKGEFTQGMREGVQRTLALKLGRTRAQSRALGSVSGPGSPIGLSGRKTDKELKGAPARGAFCYTLEEIARRGSGGRGSASRRGGGVGGSPSSPPRARNVRDSPQFSARADVIRVSSSPPCYVMLLSVCVLHVMTPILSFG